MIAQECPDTADRHFEYSDPEDDPKYVTESGRKWLQKQNEGRKKEREGEDLDQDR